MKRLQVGVVLLGLLGMLGACSAEEPDASAQRVVASFYPLAEAARQVGGDLVDVTNLTPAGVEPHDFELTADLVDTIEDAAVVLYVGKDFQPAVAKAARRSDGLAIDVGRAVVPRGSDPHFWLDPRLMQAAVIVVRDALTDAEPSNRARYKANAEEFIGELRALDERMVTALRTCARRDIVTAHTAFGALAKRFDLVENGITGVIPEAEASPARLAELAGLVRAKGVTTVFYEELVPRDFADTLAKEAGVKTAVLNPLEGLSKTELDRGDDYVTVMDRNRAALADALGCTGP